MLMTVTTYNLFLALFIVGHCSFLASCMMELFNDSVLLHEPASCLKAQQLGSRNWLQLMTTWDLLYINLAANKGTCSIRFQTSCCRTSGPIWFGSKAVFALAHRIVLKMCVRQHEHQAFVPNSNAIKLLVLQRVERHCTGTYKELAMQIRSPGKSTK